MIAVLNRLVDLVEELLTDELDVNELAVGLGTTEYHVRRMFSSLAGMPLSEYVRRRRLTVAAADVIAGEEELLSIAVRYGYGSTEAFGRAFRAVHGVGPGDVRVPLIHEGVNPHIQQHVTSFPAEEHLRLKRLSSTEPAGLLQVSDDLDPDATEGSELTYLHGVAVAPVPDDRPRPTGSPPTRGACGPDRRWSRCSTAPRTSVRRPASCGCRSNVHESPERADR